METQFVRRIPFSAYETPEALERSIALLKRMQCDRVMLFDSRGHIEPAHLDREEILRRAEVMKRAVRAFREAGIGAGINNLATVGMNFSPPRKRRLPFQNLVDADGHVYTETFCPLDEGLREHMAFQFAAWAGTGADEVWVDDDFRYKTNTAQCFCPLHLEQFARLTGRRWTREELLDAISSPGPVANELARRWGELQLEGLLGLAEAIARGARSANPAIRIAFMGITNNATFYGTEFLKRMRQILTPDRPALVRPEYGAMSDQDRTAWTAYPALWCCRRAFGDDYLAWPELETWPQTTFNHGGTVVQMKLAWGAVHGFFSSTINVNDTPRFVRTVARAKRHVRAITGLLEDASLEPRGVSLEMSENTTSLRPAPAPVTLDSLSAQILGRLGIPLWPDGGCGRILIGNAPLVRGEELAAFAREGMLLDRPAFDVLAAMGRDDILGGARPAPMGGIPVLERFASCPHNGRAARQVLSMELAITVRPSLEGFRLPAEPSFTALTHFEDADGATLSPGVWTREWSGGRLAVLPFSLAEAASANAILNFTRKAQLESLLRWLTGRPLPVTVEGLADLAVVYREEPGAARVVLALANFALDRAEGGHLRIPALAGKGRLRAHILDSASRRHVQMCEAGPDGGIELRGRLAVPPQQVRLVELAAP